MSKPRKLLSARWWLGPNSGIIGGARRWLLRALLRREDQTARACGQEPGIECPICGHQGSLFYPDRSRYDLLMFNSACPQCNAKQRHRLIKLLLDELDASSWEGPLLHFAPEPCLTQLLSGIPGTEYATADLHRSDVDHQADIQALPFEDDSWAYVVCSHVLEHVPDDEKALAELSRILRPDGILLLCVPTIDGRATTVKLGEPDPWIHGHVRDYGADFVQKAARHFEVEARSADTWPARDVVRHGLKLCVPDADILLVCRPRNGRD